MRRAIGRLVFRGARRHTRFDAIGDLVAFATRVTRKQSGKPMAAKVTGEFPPLQRGLKGHNISKGEVTSSRENKMDLPKGKSQRLVALFLLGNLLFNYPLLALFNRAGLVFGIPVLYAYVFAAWILLIALSVLVVEKR